ncbi:hypothetical protein BSKO_10131 [Bryopsis sp. KO-2023]|nr:hypothetical protein BSKO_10131 [Bryopsis sp. KO-2023]
MQHWGSAFRLMKHSGRFSFSFVGVATPSQRSRCVSTRIRAAPNASGASGASQKSISIQRLQQGMDYERTKGFVNIVGKTVPFNVFLGAEVEKLSEAVNGQEEIFRRFSRGARIYDDMPPEERKQLIADLYNFLGNIQGDPRGNGSPPSLDTGQTSTSNKSMLPLGSFQKRPLQNMPNPSDLEAPLPSGSKKSTPSVQPTKTVASTGKTAPKRTKAVPFTPDPPGPPLRNNAARESTSRSQSDSPPPAGQRKKIAKVDFSKVKLNERLISQGVGMVEDDSVVVLGMDTETNGMKGRILEVAVCNYNTGAVWKTLINPGDVVFDKIAFKIHGISPEMCQAAGVPDSEEAYKQMLAWMCKQEVPGKKLVVTTFNGKTFDYPLIRKEMQQLGMDYEMDWMFLDALVWARALNLKAKLGVPNLKLVTIREALRVPDCGVAHRADADALATGHLVNALLKYMPKGKRDLLSVVSEDTAYGGTFQMLDDRAKASPRAAKQSSSARSGKKSRPALEVVWEADPAAQVEVARQQDVDSKLKPFIVPQWTPLPSVVQDADRSIRDLLTMAVSEATFWAPKERKNLEKAGFQTVLQVAHYFPRDYNVFGSDLTPESVGNLVGVLGVIENQNIFQARGSLHVFTSSAITMDGRRVSWVQFLNGYKGKYMGKKMMDDNPIGSTVLIRGKLKAVAPNDKITLEQPLSVISGEEGAGIQAVMPIYPARTPVKPEAFGAPEQGIIPKLLKELEMCPDGVDFLPEGLKSSYDLSGWKESLIGMHRPKAIGEPDIVRKRFAFQDMLFLQLVQLAKRYMITKQTEDKGICISQYAMMNAGKKALGFKLTEGQNESLKEVLDDLEKSVPMLRLLQGDVGSGKTAVAFLAMLAVVGSGYQVSMMAPSTVLAQQHYKTFRRLISKMPKKLQSRVALLTSAVKASERREIIAGLESGSINVLIGTHALYNQEVLFKNLAFVAIDEQHKFGVHQRENLYKNQSASPHVLLMSATPIPRTLALTVHGSQLVSCLKDMPPGRKPVVTEVVDEDDGDAMEEVFELAKKELDSGGRVFVVYSLIEESQSDVMGNVKSVEQEYEDMQRTKKFGEHALVFLHSRMPQEKKFEAMESFANGETPVLVSTTVIEVGVDIPEASLMVVNNAERYGLAQLHQLRGRVGRGTRPSKCMLLTRGGADAVERLRVLEMSNNGHVIAEEDLRIRGPGDLLGSKQHGHQGLFSVSAKELLRDKELVGAARAAAARILAENNDQIPADMEQLIIAQGFPKPEDFELQ